MKKIPESSAEEKCGRVICTLCEKIDMLIDFEPNLYGSCGVEPLDA